MTHIDVWHVPLDTPLTDDIESGRFLSAMERARAAKFHKAADRVRYTRAHGALRAIVGYCASCPPEALALCTGTYGKPELAGKSARRTLQFNLSHTSELALVAVTRGPPVGIDVERIRPISEAHAIAERFFAASEYQMLKRLLPKHQTNAFLTCWTRKEALLKAMGFGLAFPVANIVVGVKANLAVCHVGKANSSVWSICSFEPADGYIAAVAARGVDVMLTHVCREDASAEFVRRMSHKETFR